MEKINKKESPAIQKRTAGRRFLVATVIRIRYARCISVDVTCK